MREGSNGLNYLRGVFLAKADLADGGGCQRFEVARGHCQRYGVIRRTWSRITVSHGLRRESKCAHAPATWRREPQLADPGGPSGGRRHPTRWHIRRRGDLGASAQDGTVGPAARYPGLPLGERSFVQLLSEWLNGESRPAVAA